jgi:hypothetical protein
MLKSPHNADHARLIVLFDVSSDHDEYPGNNPSGRPIVWMYMILSLCAGKAKRQAGGGDIPATHFRIQHFAQRDGFLHVRTQWES